MLSYFTSAMMLLIVKITAFIVNVYILLFAALNDKFYF
jgi:hypothetical protein